MLPASSEVPTPASNPPHTLQRRGLLAIAAAFVAGVVAKLSEQPVFAGTDGDVVLGAANSTAGLTEIDCTTANGRGLVATCRTCTSSALTPERCCSVLAPVICHSRSMDYIVRFETVFVPATL